MNSLNIGRRAFKAPGAGAFLPAVSFDNETLKLGKKSYDCMFYSYFITPWLLARVQLATTVLAKDDPSITPVQMNIITAYQEKLLGSCPHFVGEYGSLEVSKNKQQELIVTGNIDRTPTGGNSPFITRHYNGSGQMSQATIMHKSSSATTSYYSPLNNQLLCNLYGVYRESRVLLQLKSWPLHSSRLDLLFKLERYLTLENLPPSASADLATIIGYAPAAALECIEREMRAANNT
jgi:hypothetical protein